MWLTHLVGAMLSVYLSSLMTLGQPVVIGRRQNQPQERQRTNGTVDLHAILNKVMQDFVRSLNRRNTTTKVPTTFATREIQPEPPVAQFLRDGGSEQIHVELVKMAETTSPFNGETTDETSGASLPQTSVTKSVSMGKNNDPDNTESPSEQERPTTESKTGTAGRQLTSPTTASPSNKADDVPTNDEGAANEAFATTDKTREVIGIYRKGTESFATDEVVFTKSANVSTTTPKSSTADLGYSITDTQTQDTTSNPETTASSTSTLRDSRSTSATVLQGTVSSVTEGSETSSTRISRPGYAGTNITSAISSGTVYNKNDTNETGSVRTDRSKNMTSVTMGTGSRGLDVTDISVNGTGLTETGIGGTDSTGTGVTETLSVDAGVTGSGSSEMALTTTESTGKEVTGTEPYRTQLSLVNSTVTDWKVTTIKDPVLTSTDPSPNIPISQVKTSRVSLPGISENKTDHIVTYTTTPGAVSTISSTNEVNNITNNYIDEETVLSSTTAINTDDNNVESVTEERTNSANRHVTWSPQLLMIIVALKNFL